LVIGVLVVSSEHVLKLIVVEKFAARAIVADVDKSWVSHRLWRGQELALILDVLTVFDPRGAWLLVFNALDHLVKIEGNRHLFDCVSVAVGYKVVSFLVFGPDSAFV
jgi:hypothetical protein